MAIQPEINPSSQSAIDNRIWYLDDQIWHQNIGNVKFDAELYDHFGDSLATGDFNGDGKDDLAVGVPYNDRGAQNAGAVNVLYGSNNGLTATGNQIWHQNSPLVLGVADYLDSFGSSLATGDFDGDGRDDLAVGVPNEEVSSVSSAGAVNVLYGSNSGLTAADNQLWHQNSLFVEGGAEYSDRFGASLSVGDFNNDGYDDLAVGVPGESIGSISGAGATHILFGSVDGLFARV